MSHLYLIKKNLPIEFYYSSAWLISSIYHFVAKLEFVIQTPCSLYSPSPDCSRFCFDRAEVVSLLDTEFIGSAYLRYIAEQKESTPTDILCLGKMA